jgi:hypothetical protein
MGLGHSISFDSLILAESSPSKLLDFVNLNVRLREKQGLRPGLLGC